MLAQLVIEQGEANPRSILLSPDQEVRLGRSSKNHVVLRDEHASRRHARVFVEQGRWVILDCKTRNGTRLNGTRIKEKAFLEDGAEIRIGDSRWRFIMEEEEPQTPPKMLSEPEQEEDVEPLERDELHALYRFVKASLRKSTAPELITLALKTLQKSVGAKVAGFLSLDVENPLPRIVLPSLKDVNIHLSQRLTSLVKKEKRMIWLAQANNAKSATDSLQDYTDALCAPVQIDGIAFGAIHLYQKRSLFTQEQVHFCKVLAGSLAKSLHVLRNQRALVAENHRLQDKGGQSSANDQQMVGSSETLSQLREKIARYARADSTVLITGETGAGKELVTFAIHQLSPRKGGPLVTVNCGAIPPDMAERELFGHCEGAFTSANRTVTGYFEQADMGTLVLDEIGELPLLVQAKLLRAIETNRFRPLGAEEDVTCDTRVIAVTNRALDQECREGNFRKDLFYRLNLTIAVPPLREHMEDLPEIAQHLLRSLAAQHKRKDDIRLSKAALSHLKSYHWPGNVRQLRSVLDHAVAMTDSSLIEPEHLGPLLEPFESREHQPDNLSLRSVEEWAIRQVLAQNDWAMGVSAKQLGICADTLRTKMRDYQIEKPKKK